MSNQAFDIDLHIGNERAPTETTDWFAGEHYYRASLLQNGGITPDTFIELAERFSGLCDELYGGSYVKLVLDRAQPNISVECDKLRDALEAQPGDEIPTPANANIFNELLTYASVAEVTIKPNVELPAMPSTFAQAKWTRHAGKIMEFYAQGSSSPEGVDLIAELYARMFPERIPGKGLKVALGIMAVREQRKEGLGEEAFHLEQRERFDNNSAVMGRPGSAFYLGEQSTSKTQNRSLTSRVRRFFGNL